MAVFVRSLNCGCPDCGADPCDCGCHTSCDIGISASGGGDDDQSYDLVTGGAAVGANTGTLDVDFNDAGVADGIDVYVSGVLKWTKCGSGSTNIALVSTDTIVRVVITSRCGSPGTPTAWLYDLTCSDGPLC